MRTTPRRASPRQAKPFAPQPTSCSGDFRYAPVDIIRLFLRVGKVWLWQRRFWEHTIRDEGDFERHVDYVHFNPVKHGLVARVRDWPHSSFHSYVRRGLLPE